MDKATEDQIRELQATVQMLASGLAWSVGKLEGLGFGDGYGAEVLAWWHSPKVVSRAERPPQRRRVPDA